MRTFNTFDQFTSNMEKNTPKIHNSNWQEDVLFTFHSAYISNIYSKLKIWLDFTFVYLSFKFGWISLFNGMLTFMGHLTLKPSL